MPHSNIHKAAVLALISASLIGCASTKKTALPGRGVGPHYAQQDSSYPLYAGDGYRGGRQVDPTGHLINVLSAPAEQTYYFSFDGSEVAGSDLQAIRIQATYLANHPQARVRLEGNTDNRGSREYNVALGWRRDQAVMQLLKNDGVRSSQIRMVSYGKERPARLGDTDAIRSLNRRVHLVYERK